jgi:Kef-type K+ transport system membrane component KefB
MLLGLSTPPHPLDHPLGAWLEQHVDWWLFLLIHIALFLVGAYLAARAFQENRTTFGWGFSLFALAEIVYMTYHVNLTVFLLAHTIAEVLDAVAFVALFTAAVRAGVLSWSEEERRVSASH